MYQESLTHLSVTSTGRGVSGISHFFRCMVLTPFRTVVLSVALDTPSCSKNRIERNTIFTEVITDKRKIFVLLL